MKQPKFKFHPDAENDMREMTEKIEALARENLPEKERVIRFNELMLPFLKKHHPKYKQVKRGVE